NFAGITRSIAYGLSVCASIHASSSRSCSGVKCNAPNTPRPPALLTAATTSRQCEKASSGNSIPKRSVIFAVIAMSSWGQSKNARIEPFILSRDTPVFLLSPQIVFTLTPNSSAGLRQVLGADSLPEFTRQLGGGARGQFDLPRQLAITVQHV